MTAFETQLKAAFYSQIAPKIANGIQEIVAQLERLNENLEKMQEDKIAYGPMVYTEGEATLSDHPAVQKTANELSDKLRQGGIVLNMRPRKEEEDA